MIFGKLFAPAEVKVLKKYISQFVGEFEEELPLTSLSRYQLMSKLKKDTLNMADTKEMLELLTDDNPPHPEYQALHSIGQIIYHNLAHPPLVDIGGGSFCSADYRDVMGHLTSEGNDLKIIAHAIIDKIIEKNHEDKDSEYVINYLDVIDDATKPNTNLHISGY